jgi:hypothetical protein
MKKIALPVEYGDVKVDLDRVLCNDVQLPGDAHAPTTHLWVISSEASPLGAVWASNMQVALDVLVDSDLAGGILVDSDFLKTLTIDEQAGLAYLGNNSLACDLTNVRCDKVGWVPERDWKLLCMFAEARGATKDSLDQL